MPYQAASRLLEAAARERGLRVDRLAAELVVCDDGQRRVAFHGLAGDAIGKVAVVLCGNDGWLRQHLGRCGLPVRETRLVDLADASFAQRAAEELGFPVTVRLADPGAPTGKGVDDLPSFAGAWRAVVAAAPDHRARAILERRPDGPAVEVAVVGGQVVATRPSPDSAAGGLAVRAVAALPGPAGYASVRLLASPSGPVVDSVDPLLEPWAGSPDGLTIARAILDLEYRDGAGTPRQRRLAC